MVCERKRVSPCLCFFGFGSERKERETGEGGGERDTCEVRFHVLLMHQLASLASRCRRRETMPQTQGNDNPKQFTICGRGVMYQSHSVPPMLKARFPPFVPRYYRSITKYNKVCMQYRSRGIAARTAPPVSPWPPSKRRRVSGCLLGAKLTTQRGMGAPMMRLFFGEHVTGCSECCNVAYPRSLAAASRSASMACIARFASR